MGQPGGDPIARAHVTGYAGAMADTPPPFRTPSRALSSQAAARNLAPIMAVLGAHLPAGAKVLEIASGAGEHALEAARSHPRWRWRPSDPDASARDSIAAWREAAGIENLLDPIALNAIDAGAWPDEAFDAVVCINMVHISPWAATEGLMAGAAKVLAPGGLLYLYGPYREADVPLADSNAAFDASLKGRNPDWGLRDLDEVRACAREHGLIFTLRKAMPANNLSLIFRRP